MEPCIYLSVIIPTYNEEERIGKTLRRVDAYLKEQVFPAEILVVIDGAKDNTAKVVSDFQSEILNLHIIDRKENRGKGYTVREGMLAAKGEIRLFMDADNSTDISHFDKMKPLFQRVRPPTSLELQRGEPGGQEYDVVICSRDKKDAARATQAVPQSFFKRQLGNMGNLFIQLFVMRGIWDTQCGFKAFRAEVAERIFSRAKIDRWGFDVEALALARKFGLRIGIVPAYWINDRKSHVKLSGYLQVLWETLKIWWWLRMGGYENNSPNPLVSS